MQGREEYVSDTEQRERGRDVNTEDAPTKLLVEEFVSGMGQRQKSIAAMRGVPIMYKKEDFVRGMMVKKYRTRSHRSTNYAQKGGVCKRHGAKSRLVLLADVTTNIECTILQTREIAYFQRMERCVTL